MYFLSKILKYELKCRYSRDNNKPEGKSVKQNIKVGEREMQRRKYVNSNRIITAHNYHFTLFSIKFSLRQRI